MKTVNAFILKGDEVVLIDSGENTDESYAAMIAGLKSHQLEVTDIDRIVITHAHVDHIGMAQRVAEAANAKVWVSEKTHPYALDPTAQWGIRKNLILGTVRSFFPADMHAAAEANYMSFSGKMSDVWMSIDPSFLEFFESEGTIEMCGQEWETIYMPGHSNTQSTFYNHRSGAYLAADMLLKISSTPVLEPIPEDDTVREKGILTMLDSYKRLSDYDLKKVYPGHYEVFEDGNAMIDRHVKRIYQRTEQCFEIIKRKSPASISFLDLFQEMYKGRWHMPALVMQIGYLDLLENQGKIQYDDSQGYTRIVSSSASDVR